MKAKFDPYASRTLRAAFLARLPAVSEWVWITGTRMGCRDPDDDKFLETAFLGEVNALVSGDQDLLQMAGSTEVPILSPADFLERLG